MAKEKTKTTYSGIGFISLLQLLFIGLKLAGVINWNWFWVLSPFIFSFGLFVVIILIVIVVTVVKTIIQNDDENEKN